MNDSAISLLGETRCWSLLGFKGLILAVPKVQKTDNKNKHNANNSDKKTTI